MGVHTIETESASSVPPAKLYKAFVIDFDNFVPKAFKAIQSVEVIEGNGGPGTIKKVTAVFGGETKHVLYKVEAFDEANWGYNYQIIGGFELPENVDKVSVETKLVEGPDGGSIAKFTAKFETKGDVLPNVKEHAKAESKTRRDAFFRAIETYLSANPDYN
ncbi:hypothetical protein TanjilG_29039 [Lupinus angustifolius]|uniref:Bet v I/Major latex protein domain-containing protein n=1 Tax=Lupinus angustifolius TaxID=3871 RepID=A0A4P1RT24_LUPAN|nr:PREDICTED: class-10 pathogenesis-related protein 1-like [Lupinus angustifolius]OIW17689.1 hypothetical protein TanjilG_29039 [Lupinus angustifolius]